MDWVGRAERDLVDNRVDPSATAAATVRPARRGRQDRRTEIASRTIVPPPVASGASLPLRCGRLTTAVRGGRARRDVIGIPVSILPSGRRSPAAPTVCARMRSGGPRDRPVPAAIRPIDQPARLDALVAAVRARSAARARDRDRPRLRASAGSPTSWQDAVAIPFADLPGWPAATAPGTCRAPPARASWLAGRS